MNKQDRKKYILELLDRKETIKVSDVVEIADVERTTIYRDFTELTEQGLLQEIAKGVYKKRTNPTSYLQIPFFDRPKKSYNFDFLGSYIPNVTSFLGDAYERIQSEYVDLEGLSTYDYRVNIRAIENLLIDLSFSSSKLEGNTYSYLDTEVLIKYNTSPDGKSPFETQMILNHKNAIKYIIENRTTIEYIRSEFQNIHTLLGK